MGGYRVAVGTDGLPWVITRKKQIFRQTKAGWTKVRGTLDDISIGPEGSIIGVRRNKGIWKYNQATEKWFKIGKFGLNVAVGPGG